MRKVPPAVTASLVLALFGVVLGAIYLVERVSSDTRADGFLESSAALLLIAWVVAAVQAVRARR